MILTGWYLQSSEYFTGKSAFNKNKQEVQVTGNIQF